MNTVLLTLIGCQFAAYSSPTVKMEVTGILFCSESYSWWRQVWEIDLSKQVKTYQILAKPDFFFYMTGDVRKEADALVGKKVVIESRGFRTWPNAELRGGITASGPYIIHRDPSILVTVTKIRAFEK